MLRMRRSSALLLLLVPACFPRSMVIGQTAAMPGARQAEVGVSTGVAFSQSTPPSSSTTQDGTSSWQIPNMEANLQLGLGSAVALNLHASPAGLQPGIKIGGSSGNVSFAVLPEVAGGYVVQNSGGNKSELGSVLLGVKVLLSTLGGVYGGIGYDHLIYKEGDSGLGGSASTVNGEELTVGLGVDAHVGSLMLRPEVDGMYATNLKDDMGNEQGTLLSIVFGVTFAISSEHK
jgi:hypothetical protein